MRLFKFILSLCLTAALVYFLNRGWNFGNPIPPLGKFLDPFHGVWQNAERASASSETLTIPGLKEEVNVIYDSADIPHIFARNNEDLYLAQGYLHARERLWQMEFQTLAAAGRLSEILGPNPAILNFDRYQRRLGMVHGAANTLQGILADAELKPCVESYSKGVNAYIQQLSYSSYPFEYKLLDYSPEPWSEMKIGLFFMNMAKTLNMRDNDMEMTNALRLFGPELVDILYPDHELQADPIVEKPNGWKFKPVTIPDSIPSAAPAELIPLHQPKEKTRGIGSNNWVVSGTRTATGSPILCNDPHLSLSMPSLWYVVHLNAPGINTMGASFPGAPCVILGFNDSIAWGCTNAQRDLNDWYKIQFKDKTKSEYLSDGQWRKSTKVIEKFIVKGGDPFYDTVVYTHHGPVVYDESYHAENERSHYAFRWISHDVGKPLKVFYLLDRGKNFQDYSNALDTYESPAQNFAFGSVGGDIAIRVQGRFPVRRKNEGKYVLDGTRTSTEWQAFIPMDQNAMVRNPGRGYLFSANQYPVDDTYPYYVHTGDPYETYRNRRISQVLAGLTRATPQDLMKLHNDNFNWQAFESVSAFLSHLDTAHLAGEEKEAYELLKSWDFENSIESKAAIYYEAWWNALLPMLWDEMLSDKTALERPSEYTTIRIIKEIPDLPLYDRLDTPEKESLTDVMRASFAQGVKSAAEWRDKNKDKAFRWADYKDTYIRHLLRIPALGFHAVNGGNTGIVNASAHDWGPSWRMVVSLEKTGVKAWGVYPGGQSGNPGSPFYHNLLSRWEKGEYVRMNFTGSADALKASALKTMTLKP